MELWLRTKRSLPVVLLLPTRTFADLALHSAINTSHFGDLPTDLKSVAQQFSVMKQMTHSAAMGTAADSAAAQGVGPKIIGSAQRNLTRGMSMKISDESIEFLKSVKTVMSSSDASRLLPAQILGLKA